MTEALLPRRGSLCAALALCGLSACTMGPDYKRPDVDLPKDFGVVQSTVPAPEKWWSLFNDPVLEKLEDEALGHNHDLAAAAQRIEQARAQLSISRADQLPSVGVEATRTRSRASQLGSIPIPPEFVETNDNRLVARLSWELDFWGKYRRATEAARADLVASEAGRDAVRTSLVSDLARGYFALLALDRRLATLERAGD
jgi:multidrug efflux system outer membrane protein